MALLVGARVYNDADISIATSGVEQALTFNSERYDTDGIHSTVSNTGRLTCQTAGIYAISANIRFASNATGYRYIVIKLNGATAIALSSLPIVANALCVLEVSTKYELAISDYLEVVVLQTSGGALNVVAAGNYSPEFMMHRIG